MTHQGELLVCWVRGREAYPPKRQLATVTAGRQVLGAAAPQRPAAAGKGVRPGERLPLLPP
jgi:hypothetical protein